MTVPANMETIIGGTQNFVSNSIDGMIHEQHQEGSLSTRPGANFYNACESVHRGVLKKGKVSESDNVSGIF